MLAGFAGARYTPAMRAYFDAFSGISGDMTAGALLDLGFAFADLERHVAALPIAGCGLPRERPQHGPIPAAKFAMGTPTGGAIRRGFGGCSATPPSFTLARGGTGSGTSRPAGRPNVLRILRGEPASATRGDEMLVIETNIDDMSPELYEHATARLF